jgi:hypothetical protein
MSCTLLHQPPLRLAQLPALLPTAHRLRRCASGGSGSAATNAMRRMLLHQPPALARLPPLLPTAYRQARCASSGKGSGSSDEADAIAFVVERGYSPTVQPAHARLCPQNRDVCTPVFTVAYVHACAAPTRASACLRDFGSIIGAAPSTFTPVSTK